MTKLTFLLLFSVFINTLSSQQLNYSKSYYPSINDAELAIVDGNLTAALTLYKEAFSRVDHAFAIDLYNALVCAAQLDSIQRVHEFSTELITIGIEKKVLLQNLVDFPNAIKNIESIKPSYSRYEDKKGLRQKFELLSLKDQQFRTLEGSYTKYGRQIDSIDIENMIHIKSLIEDVGFPSEKIFGTNKIDNSFESSIVFHHHCQQRSMDTVDNSAFTELFHTSINNGTLEPHTAAFLLNLQSKNTEIQLAGQGSIIFQEGDNESELLQESIPVEMIETINTNRSEFGLETIEEFYRKSEFAFFSPKSQYYNFSKFTRTNIFPLPSEIYEKIVSAYKQVNQNYR